MSIAAMKKLTLAGANSDRRQVVAEMMRLGCIEINDIAPDGAVAGLIESGAMRRDDSAEAAVLADRARIEAALAVLDRYAHQKKPMFAPKPEVHEFVLFDERTAASAKREAETVLALSEQAEELAAGIRSLEGDAAALEPWRGMDVPLELTGGRSFRVIRGTVPSYVDVPALQAEVRQDAPTAELERVGADKQVQYLCAVTARSESDAAVKVLRERGFAEQNFKGGPGTAADNIGRLRTEIAEKEAEKKAVEEQLAAHGPNTALLERAYDALTNEARREQVRSGIARTENVFYLEGWLPEASVKSAQALFERMGCAWSFSDPGETDDVPVRLDNNRIVSPYNEITSMYGMPAYNSLIDPNPTMAFFYFLCFGLMLSDAAYGILLALGCFFYLKKAKPSGSMKNMLTMFLFGGISTAIWGAVFGSWFGNAASVIAEGVFHKTFVMPALIDPISEPIKMMVLSYVIGGIQVMTAMFLDALRRIKRRDIAGAIFGIFAWYVLFAGIGVLFLNKKAGLIVAGIGLLGVMIGGTLGKKGLSKFTGAFLAVYNITGIFSDVLSYSRLLALCLSTAVVAQVVNIMGSLNGFTVGGTILFIVVFIVGHVFNLALNLLGTYVHTSRLQYIEYFGRFYEGGGRTFKPLTLQTKYVDIVKED
ncbi:MAG: V-type ATP synthase subunit I [Oscillospiraceae bacterium]|nr:V-type ATP synthase subunit I [Oscillospiraceae bacterium]